MNNYWIKGGTVKRIAPLLYVMPPYQSTNPYPRIDSIEKRWNTVDGQNPAPVDR